MEVRLERGMRNFQRAEYGGVTETWNVIQHEVLLLLVKLLFPLTLIGVGDRFKRTYLF
jgi:hypothetical protein